MSKKFEFRPLMGSFERKFQNDSWDIMQKALWVSGIRVVTKPTDEIREALSKIGMRYKDRTPDFDF